MTRDEAMAKAAELLGAEAPDAETLWMAPRTFALLQRRIADALVAAAGEERSNAARLALYVPTPPGCAEADTIRQAIHDDILAGEKAHD